MQGINCFVVLGLLLASSGRAQRNPPPDTFVTLNGNQLLASSSDFGGSPSKYPGADFQVLAAPGDLLACNAIAPAPVPASGAAPPAALIARGNCSFAQKVRNAQAAGYSAALVFDSVAGAYASSMINSNANGSALYGNACAYDCSQGLATVPPSVATLAQALSGFPGQCGSSCASGMCILAAPDASPPQRQLCCMVATNTLSMGGGSTGGITIPSAFLSYANGAVLLAAATAANNPAAPSPAPVVTMGLRYTPPVDGSTILLCAIGIAVVALASWRSAEVERERLEDAKAEAAARVTLADNAEAAAAAAAERRRKREEAIRRRVVQERVQLTLREGLWMLVLASAVLITLFFLVRAGVPIIYFVITIFSLGALQSLYLLVFYPLFSSERILHCKGLGRLLDTKRMVDVTVRSWRVAFTYAQGLALMLSFTLVVVWLATRNASGSWILQDSFGVVLCCLFLLQLQVNKLRDVSLILVAFFAYDVFAVLIAPYVFGSSPMIDVATAGQPSLPPGGADNWDCYCRINPQDRSVCGQGEFMPLLFRIPRYSDYRGGYSMLGFGDIVLPGLLLSLCLRFDLALQVAETAGEDAVISRRMGQRRAANTLVSKISYWAVAMLGYAVGLVLAMVAVTVFASGQPALLYLVPCTVIPVLALCRYRGDWDLWWTWGGIDGAEEAAAAAAAGTGGDARAGNAAAGGVGGGATASLTAAADAAAERELEVTAADVNVAVPAAALAPRAAANANAHAANAAASASADVGAYEAIEIHPPAGAAPAPSAAAGADAVSSETALHAPAGHGSDAGADDEDENVPLTSDAARK